MTIWDDLGHHLPELQRQAEGGMIETCRIERVQTSSDEHGNTVEVPLDPPVYVGIAKIRSYRPYEEEREVAGATSTSQRYDTHIPAPERMAYLLERGVIEHWNGPVRNGDRLTRTTPGRAQVVYRVATEHDITYQTAQRLVADLQTGGIQ